MTIYGYARVSSGGQSLETQLEMLNKEHCEQIYSEKITGMKLDRPELNKLLDIIKEGDKLVVTKLDRIARSTQVGINIIDSVVGKGATIHILNMGLFDNSPSGKMFRTMMFAFSEFERDMIVERTSAGREYAKRTNPDFHEGGKLPPRDMVAAFLDAHANGTPVAQYAKQIDRTRATLYNWLNRYTDPEELAKLPK